MVAADAGHDHVPGDSISQALVPASHDETRGEALEVPLPRSRMSLSFAASLRMGIMINGRSKNQSSQAFESCWDLSKGSGRIMP